MLLLVSVTTSFALTEHRTGKDTFFPASSPAPLRKAVPRGQSAPGVTVHWYPSLAMLPVGRRGVQGGVLGSGHVGGSDDGLELVRACSRRLGCRWRRPGAGRG